LHSEVVSLLTAADDDDSLPDARRAIASAAGLALGRSATGSSGLHDPSEYDRQLLSGLEAALGQQFEIVRPLGRGGMGAVYLARERALERFVAIKVLRPDLASGADGRERFRREARIAAQLSHPGILPLHTFGEVRGLWYFVMGYAPGVSLAERLRVEGRLSSAEAHQILIELADAVECAHRHGVVHRDIKPANILIDSDMGRAMLADFGISKVHGAGDSLTATGAVIGTPHFMSPEQSVGSPAVDERSDIYSIGAVGYTMLAGREPFADATPQQLAYRRVTADPVSLVTAAPSVTPELAHLVMRCLARDPAARWPDARTLREGLEDARNNANGTLPESLRDLPAFGPYALLWVLAWTVIAIRATRSPEDRLLLLLIAALVPLGFVLHIGNLGRHQRGKLGLAKVAFWPPEWWGMWWPHSLRRPSDLWRRLPRPARAVRAVLSAFIVALPGMIVMRGPLERAVNSQSSSDGLGWFAATEATLVLVAACVTAAGLWWARRQGLDRADAVRILFGATSPSAGWNAPNIVRLLARAGRGSPPDRDAPSDHARAIADVVSSLPASVWANGTEPLKLARRLLVAIENCDGDIAAYSASANATELDRLTAHLTTLEQDDVTNSAERNELRELVRRQLEVVRRMRVRCERQTQRRTQLISLLRGLSTQLAILRDVVESGGEASGAVQSRLGALCTEIESTLATES